MEGLMEKKKEKHIQMLLHQILHLSMHKAMQLLKEYDLKPGQAGILFVLHSNGELSQKEVAKKVGVTPPSITVAIKKMEKFGFIVRKVDVYDQRVIRLRLTDKGRAYVAQIEEVQGQMEEILFDNMSTEERIIIKRLLEQMRDNLVNSKELQDIKLCPPMH